MTLLNKRIIKITAAVAEVMIMQMMAQKRGIKTWPTMTIQLKPMMVYLIKNR